MNQPIEFNAQVLLRDQRVIPMLLCLAGSARFCFAALGFTPLMPSAMARRRMEAIQVQEGDLAFFYVATLPEAHSTRLLRLR